MASAAIISEADCASESPELRENGVNPCEFKGLCADRCREGLTQKPTDVVSRGSRVAGVQAEARGGMRAVFSGCHKEVGE